MKSLLALLLLSTSAFAQLVIQRDIRYLDDGHARHVLDIYAPKDAKNLPVVINPHGGPWARDGWGFDPEVQFLANRGYAVLQLNFRGSTGYGRAFWEKSFKQWGRTMQDDISDGVAWLVKEGCDHLQGYLFSRPLPPAEFARNYQLPTD